MVHYFTTDDKLGGSRKLKFIEKQEFQLDCRWEVNEKVQNKPLKMQQKFGQKNLMIRNYLLHKTLT